MSRPSAPPPITPDAIALAWLDFTGRLAHTLAALRDRHFLILSTADGARYIQFAAKGENGLRLESISDAYLPYDDRLTADQADALHALGWQPPTQRALGEWGIGDASGSTNWWLDLEQPVPFAAAADLGARTLRDVHGAASPDTLTYRAFHGDGPELLLPELGVAEEPAVDDLILDDGDEGPLAREAALVDQVREALQYAADDGVREDAAGHFHLTVHRVPLRVVIEHDLALLRVIAELIDAPIPTAEVLANLNHVNAHRISYGYLYWREGQVRYAAELLVDPCDGAQVVATCTAASAVVRGLGGAIDPLAAHFVAPWERPAGVGIA